MRKWYSMSDVFIQTIWSWAYAKTSPRLCDQYLGRKTGEWFDQNGKYIICGGEIEVDTKAHTAICKKCGSEWQEFRYTIKVENKAQCPFCNMPDPLWDKDHSKHSDDEIEVNCPNCHNNYFVVIKTKHFVQPNYY